VPGFIGHGYGFRKPSDTPRVNRAKSLGRAVRVQGVQSRVKGDPRTPEIDQVPIYRSDKTRPPSTIVTLSGSVNGKRGPGNGNHVGGSGQILPTDVDCPSEVSLT
jgi:hypothetical protein